MSFEVKITTQAQDDINNIFEYIAFTLKSPNAAIGQLNRLENGINGLNEMPERFRVYDREPWKSRNLRIMPVDNYLVFYIPENDTKIVTVIRVMYGGRDIERQLNSV